MPDFSQIALAWFAGLVAGFVESMPIGPINLTILNEGARRGFKWAMLIGLGAATMDVVYSSLSFAGFSALFEIPAVKTAIAGASLVLVLYLGFKFLFLHSIPASKTAERVEERLHPHSAFATGFVRVLGNPGVLLLWITIMGAFTSHEWVRPAWPDRVACITGVGMGASLWFLLLSYLVSLKHRQFSPDTLIKISKYSGIFLLGLGVFIALRIAFMLAGKEHLMNPFGK